VCEIQNTHSKKEVSERAESLKAIFHYFLTRSVLSINIIEVGHGHIYSFRHTLCVCVSVLNEKILFMQKSSKQ
jgi:hypothetical protein